MPTDAPADLGAAAIRLSAFDGADVYVDVSVGTGDFCLIQYGPGAKWRQYGPGWTSDTTTAGGAPARLSIPLSPGYYGVLRTSGTPTVTAAYIEGVNRGSR